MHPAYRTSRTLKHGRYRALTTYMIYYTCRYLKNYIEDRREERGREKERRRGEERRGEGRVERGKRWNSGRKRKERGWVRRREKKG